ncbi:MAG TPA: hypothetical protein VGD40_09385 [Chryseosolibacter sp.]
MKYLYCLFLLSLLSCSTSKQELPGSSIRTDTSLVGSVLADASVFDPILRKEGSTMFIGETGYHAETNEFYGQVYYIADSVDETFFEDMMLEHDSTVFESDDLTRTRLRMDVAKANFNLAGLDTITVFNAKGHKICTAVLTRVEYLNDLVEGSYTAVFKPETKIVIQDEPLYCTSQGKTSFTERARQWQEVIGAEADQQLLKIFALSSEQVSKISHLQFKDDNTTYSSVSAHSGASSMLVETKDGKSVALMKLDEGYSLSKLQPVHFSYHDRPVFLSAIMPNETDGYFEVLIAFDGAKYEVLQCGRTK